MLLKDNIFQSPSAPCHLLYFVECVGTTIDSTKAKLPNAKTLDGAAKLVISMHGGQNVFVFVTANKNQSC